MSAGSDFGLEAEVTLHIKGTGGKIPSIPEVLVGSESGGGGSGKQQDGKQSYTAWWYSVEGRLTAISGTVDSLCDTVKKLKGVASKVGDLRRIGGAALICGLVSVVGLVLIAWYCSSQLGRLRDDNRDLRNFFMSQMVSQSNRVDQAGVKAAFDRELFLSLSLIHISEPTRPY